MNNPWALLWTFLVLFLWIGAWNLVDKTVDYFYGENYAAQMIVYGVMFAVALIIAIPVYLFVPGLEGEPALDGLDIAESAKFPDAGSVAPPEKQSENKE